MYTMKSVRHGLSVLGTASIPLIATALIPTPSFGATTENPVAPLNYFLHGYGPASAPTMRLGWVFTTILVAIFIIVSLLLAWALLRKRAVEDYLSIGREEGGILWVYIGAGISTGILFALAIYTLITLNAIAKPAFAPALTLTVTGYDWWWKVEYDDDDPSRRFVTANEIHIPVGLPVLVKLKSSDVIHAFWAPMLAGKTQMIPGLTNQQWIQADIAGVYRGQCTQFCGVQHAHMGFEVIAENTAEFQKWRDEQLKEAVMDSDIDMNKGMKLFMDRCAGCHAIRGTKAVGAHAPDLTHLNSRGLIAAGLLTNSPDNLVKWITHAQDIKPGSRMPNIELTTTEISIMSAFLGTLK